MEQVASHVRRNIVGNLALFFALTGTSYAATTRLLPPNSVGTKQAACSHQTGRSRIRKT